MLAHLKTFSFRGEEGTKDVLSITFRVPIAFKPCHEPSPKKSSSQPPDLKIIFGFAAGRELVELWDCISDNVCFPLFSLRSLCLATWREIERAGSYHFESSESNCIFIATSSYQKQCFAFCVFELILIPLCSPIHLSIIASMSHTTANLIVLAFGCICFMPLIWSKAILGLWKYVSSCVLCSKSLAALNSR